MPPESVRGGDERDDEASAPLPPRPEEKKKKSYAREALTMAALFLALEKKNRKGADALVRDASLALAGEMALAPQSSPYAAAYRYGRIEARGAFLEDALYRHFLSARGEVRNAIDSRFPPPPQGPGAGAGAPPSPPSPPRKGPGGGSVAAEAKDRVEAKSAASTLRDHFTRAHVAAVDEGTKKALGDARKSLAPRVDAVVTTETGKAFNDAVRRAAADAAGTYLEWVAVLDKRTCGACGRLDGRPAEDDLPPLHPRCRCFVVPRRK